MPETSSVGYKSAKSGSEPHVWIIDRDQERGLTHGLTVFTAAFFIAGGMAGCGVLALPNAVVNTGWIGVVLIFVLGILSGTCGIVLSRSWLIFRRDSPECQEHVRYPYAALGFHTYGKAGKYVVQICINATLIGYCVVFLLLASENLHSLFDLGISSAKNEYRVWLVIFTAVLLPLSWLGTPKDFWPVGMFALFTTFIACLLIAIKIGINFDGVAEQRRATTSSFFSAFGTVAFAFGGTSSFPTFQCDMRQPSLFSSSVVMSYIAVLALYLPFSILGFLALGDDVKANVVLNLSATSGITKCVVALIVSHLLFAFITTINPVSQQVEEWLNLPKGRVTVKSCLVRSFLVLFIHGLAQGIPHFDLFLNLLGSSTTTLLTFVFPCLFYLRLQSDISLHFRAFLYEITVVAMVLAVISTYFAIKAIIQELSS